MLRHDEICLLLGTPVTVALDYKQVRQLVQSDPRGLEPLAVHSIPAMLGCHSNDPRVSKSCRSSYSLSRHTLLRLQHLIRANYNIQTSVICQVNFIHWQVICCCDLTLCPDKVWVGDHTCTVPLKKNFPFPCSFYTVIFLRVLKKDD